MIVNLRPEEIRRRSEEARRLSSPCRLCPRECEVDRAAGEKGYCGAGADPSVASAIAHFGEEPPICGKGGSGTIFFSRCNLRCVYCQNHQISQGSIGSPQSPHALAREMMRLQAQGCSTMEPVSPSHHLPGLLEALAIAVDNGLSLPIVYNTNGYESAETLDLLDGIVDVYLPDLKYADPHKALQYSDAEDYVEIAREAVLHMHGQVGNLVVDVNGNAVQGMILRHLVLPNGISGTEETLQWIRANLPITVTLSLMAQYSPWHRSSTFPELNRDLTDGEYDACIDMTWDLGFRNVFIQDLASSTVCIPDFCKEEPFQWD
jgi:putative pyruvate formate lyase activating enzyme